MASTFSCKWPVTPKGYVPKKRVKSNCSVIYRDRGPCWTPPRYVKGRRRCNSDITRYGVKIWRRIKNAILPDQPGVMPPVQFGPPQGALPIRPVQGVPGGTLLNPVMRPVPAIKNTVPMPGGTNSRVDRSYAEHMAASASRGTGFASAKAPIQVAQGVVLFPGAASRVDRAQAVIEADLRNPAYADRLLPGMSVGSTRIFK